MLHLIFSSENSTILYSGSSIPGETLVGRRSTFLRIRAQKMSSLVEGIGTSLSYWNRQSLFPLSVVSIFLFMCDCSIFLL